MINKDIVIKVSSALFAIVIFVILMVQFGQAKTKLEYCHQEGFDGYEGKDMKGFWDLEAIYSDDFICYKEIPREDGVGIDYEYSGLVKFKEIKNKNKFITKVNKENSTYN